MPRPGEDWWTDEEGYPEYLEMERHLFAWCLVRIGDLSEETSAIEALARYPFEPPEAPYRGMIFHREPWTWAMWRLFGDDHKKWPAVDPSIRSEYQKESERFCDRVVGSAEPRVTPDCGGIA